MDDKIQRFLTRNGIQAEAIKYMTREDGKTCIHLLSGQVIRTYIPTKTILEQLPQEDFLNISKGVVVALSQIDYIDKFTYHMKDGTTLEGRHRTPAVHKRLNRQLYSLQAEVAPQNMSYGLSLLDNMPIAFCVIELVINPNGIGMDFIFRYCNKQMEVVEGKKISEMLNLSFFKVFPNADKKWLVAYTDVAINGGIRHILDYSPEIGKDLYVSCFQPKEGYCACALIPADELTHTSFAAASKPE